MQSILPRQTRVVSERLRSLQKLFCATFEVRKDAVLDILQASAKNETNSRQEVREMNMGETSHMDEGAMDQNTKSFPAFNFPFKGEDTSKEKLNIDRWISSSEDDDQFKKD